MSRKLIGLAMIALSGTSFAEEEVLGDWIYSSRIDGGMAATQDIFKSAFSLMCLKSSGGCFYIIQSSRECKPSRDVPALLTTEVTSITVNVSCAQRTPDGGYPIVIGGTEKVTELIMGGTKIAIAIPAGNGTISNYSFSLNGASQAISSVVKHAASLLGK